MLMTESLAIGEMFRDAIADRYGEDALPSHFRAFDTICSATQERQDAVIALLNQQPLDLMLVVGGYNSSNTCNLARICAERAPTFHIADPGVPGFAGRGAPPPGRRPLDHERPRSSDAKLAAERRQR